MPELMDHVAYLSQEIGPRPAGTEEEQQAALYITEQLQKDAGLSAVIEDFNSASNADTPRAICCIGTFIITLASLFLPILGIPAIFLTAVCAALFLLEAFGTPIISRLLSRGVSQNVVAKYEPGYTADGSGSRRRKVIVVARYDSGKVQSELSAPFLGVLHFSQWATLVSMVVLPILLIVRNLFFLHATGVTEIVFNVITGICLVFVAIPLIVAAIHKFSAYNEAANSNATGTAVLLDVARRVGRGRISASELVARAEEAGAVIHGEAEAVAAGLVPEGAKLAYEAANLQPPDLVHDTPESRLASAKAAIAALTGEPVPHSEPIQDISHNLVQIKEVPVGPPTQDAIKEQRDETREALTMGHHDEVSGMASASAPIGERVDGGELEASPVTHLSPDDVALVAATADVVVPVAGVTSGQPSRSESSSVPDWFKKAQENAKKPKDTPTPKAMRSRYADAGEAALPANPSRSEQSQSMVDAETEHRLRQLREGIRDGRTGQPLQQDAVADTESRAFGGDDARMAEPGDAASAAFAGSQVTGGRPIEAQVAGRQPVRRGEPGVDMQSAEQQPDALWPQSIEDREVVGDVSRAATALPDSTTAMPPIDISDLKSELSDIAAMQEAGAASLKPAISLPDIGVSATSLPTITEASKQRAPLAEAEESGKTAAKSLLTMLPSIGAAEVAAEKEGKDPSELSKAVDRKPNLATLPSLSGELGKSVSLQGDFGEAEPAQATGSVSLAGSFASASATGTFAPVGDELLENVSPDEIYIDDADDSEYGAGVTETGAFAGPGYVEMPKSRARRFFDRFSRKKKDEETSAQEWLDVDEDFEARSAGAARGGWESFRDDEDGYSDEPLYDEEPGIDGFEEDEFDNGKRPWQGGAFSRRRLVNKDEESVGELDLDEAPASQASFGPDEAVSDEMQQIYQFRNPDVDVEVWFVALGSELAGNAGMKAFLAEHGTDLRGSVIINLNALGNGTLSLIEKEGMYRQVKASSRMKRYMRKASQATGVDAQTATINWTESAASVALRHGYQAMSVTGMDRAKPALFAQADDVLENVDPDTLQGNADFVMELLKNI